MKDPRLKLIPGTKRQRDTQNADEQMAMIGLGGLPLRQALHLIEAHLSGRPDLDPVALEHLANAIGRLAHMEARK